MIGFNPPICKTYGPGDSFALGLFSEDWALEAWERQTYGGCRVEQVPMGALHKWWHGAQITMNRFIRTDYNPYTHQQDILRASY